MNIINIGLCQILSLDKYKKCFRSSKAMIYTKKLKLQNTYFLVYLCLEFFPEYVSFNNIRYMYGLMGAYVRKIKIIQ